MKKEEEDVENTDKVAASEDGDRDEDGQMRGGNDDDLLDPSAAPNVGTDPRMSIVDLEESLKKELAGRKVQGMTLDDGDKIPASTNGAAAAPAASGKSGSTADAAAKKKKKGCCVIS